MKAYIITREGFPHGMAATKRIQNYCRCFIMQGFDCEVIIYTRTEVYGKTPKNLCGQGVFDNITFRYISGTPLRESCIVTRRINDYRDRYKLLKFLKTNLNPDDIVIGYNGLDLFSSKIIDAIHRTGARYFQEICEYPYIGDKEIYRKRFESKILPKVNGVIVISKALEEYVKSHCTSPVKIVSIPILVDSNTFCTIPRSECQPCDTPYIFHCGTLYQQKDGIISMLKAFAMATRHISFPVKFISTGDIDGSPHEYEIKRILMDYDLSDKVVFTGYISDEKIQQYLAHAAFVVINKPDNEQNRFCFSTKLGEYMASGKAIITTKVGETVYWLTDKKDALLVEPENEVELVDAIVRLFKDNELTEILGMNARATCERCFSLSANSAKFVSELFN